jgi:predicted MPP superfamily phosphohydrolase
MTRSRYILIGDVHGCLVELQVLIRRIALRPDDTFVFLGDLVDKGPDSPGVVRWVRHFSTVYHVVCIEGNHEEKHRRWRQHMRVGSPVVHTMTGTHQIAVITKSLGAADIAFLETGRLYFRIPPAERGCHDHQDEY